MSSRALGRTLVALLAAAAALSGCSNPSAPGLQLGQENGSCESSSASINETCVDELGFASMQDCTQPHAEFRVPSSAVPATPYPLQGDTLATVALHVSHCETAQLNGTDIGPVSQAWVGPYVERGSQSPNGGSTFVAECFTDNPQYLLWLRHAGFDCLEGKIDIVVQDTASAGVQLIAFETQAAGTYSAPFRSHIASGSWNFDIDRMAENQSALRHSYHETDLGMVAGGVVSINAGYLGTVAGPSPFLATSSSQGLGGSLEVRLVRLA